MGWADTADLLEQDVLIHLGEAITYTATGEAPAVIQGVFRRTGFDTDTPVEVGTFGPQLGIRLADLTVAPSEGDQVVIRGQAYTVVGEPDPTGGGGWVVLDLHEA